MEKIGLMPSAGIANRLGSLASSKELLPIGSNARKKALKLKAISTFGHLFADHHFIDVGNPDNLAQALKEYFVEKS